MRTVQLQFAKSVQDTPPVPERLLVVEEDYHVVAVDPVTNVVWTTLDGRWWRHILEPESRHPALGPEVQVPDA